MGDKAKMSSQASVPGSVEAAVIFRMKRVAEIKKIEVKLRIEAEEKGLQLKTMFATRYRDLISAADEIKGMEDKVDGVMKVIEQVKDEAASLKGRLDNDIEDMIAQQSRDEDDNELLRQKSAHAIGTRLKFVVETREQLFACLDNNKVFEAAQRYAGAVASKKALLSDEHMKSFARFVDIQWREVERFCSEIESAAKSTLELRGLESKEYAGALAALLLVSEMSPMEATDVLLTSRLTWIEETLKGEDTMPADAFGAVAIELRNLFCNMNDILLAPPEDKDPEIRSIEESVKASWMFKPEQVRSKVLDWLESLKRVINRTNRECLQKSKSGRDLRSILEACDVLLGEDDDQLKRVNLAMFGSESPAIISELLRPVIWARASEVVVEAVQKVFTKAEDEINQVIGAIADRKKGDGHVGRTIWEDDRSLAGTLMKSGPELIRKVGFARKLVDDFEEDIKSNVTDDFGDLRKLVPEISDACRQTCASGAARLLEEQRRSIRTLGCELETVGVGDLESLEVSVPVESLLLISRVSESLSRSKALSDLFCFALEEGAEEFTRCQALASEFVDAALQTSLESYGCALKAVAGALSEQLHLKVVDQKALREKIGWERLTEDVNSLRYPATPSPPAFDFCLSACRMLSYVGGFAVSPQVVAAFSKELFDGVLAVYKACAENCTTSEVDQDALRQAFFDERFLSVILLGDDASRIAGKGSEEMRKLERTLKDGMDQVDWASSEKQILAAIRAATVKSSIVLGGFGRVHSRRRLAQFSPSMTEGFKSSSLLELAPSAPRFQYLPALLPSSYQRRVLTTKAALQSLEAETGGRVKAAEVGAKKSQADEPDVVAMASSIASNFGRLFAGFGGDQTRS